MSWLQPTPFEISLVADLRQRWSEVLPLARLLGLATRIEPLLLRNARLHFLPGSASEIESLLWFNPLIGARNSTEVIVHPGAARLLADDLRGDPDLFEEAVAFTHRHTRHWSPEDRLEQELRFNALLDDQDKLRHGLRDMLKRLYEEVDDEQRIRLARWSRRCVAASTDAQALPAEALLLTQFATYSLGASASLAPGDAPEPLPDWLAKRLPEPSRTTRLAVELRYSAEDRQQYLHFLAPADSGPAIELPTPLPANLYVQYADTPAKWQIVSVGKLVPLTRPTTRILLTTIAGRRYELRAGPPPDPIGADMPSSPALCLSHLAEDREQAQEIAEWLRGQGLRVSLQQESDDAEMAPVSEDAGEPLRLLQLWTPAARERLAGKLAADAPSAARRLLLRVDPAVSIPEPGHGADQLLDLPDLHESAQAEQTAAFLRQLHDWLSDETPAEPPEPPPVDPASEVDRLLAELQNPQTQPPRRLEIGDRLAEIGDSRLGVGVREHVPPAEAEQLLSEIDEPQTIPPRRLEIGDRLAEIGDPRRGVGLDSRGLPDLDWVEIPGGDFVYQGGERRTLAAFRMARYPITNVQYQTFIAAGGYEDGRWWKGLKRSEPQPSRWPQANRPRTNVDWYEAVAFCRWLTAQLGHEVRLPNELEWERATRGRDGREYPWGDSYESGQANLNEKFPKTGEWYLQQTTAVGMYPQGASSEGMLDLSGNVWEWCLNKYERPEQTAADSSGDRRVLRGGSWYVSPDLACGSYRSSNNPDYRYVLSGGFRVVSSALIR